MLHVAGPKRTKTQREADLVAMARLDLHGHSTREIGRELGLSHVQVARDLKKLRLRFAAESLQARREAVVEKLAQLRDVRAEAWRSFEASKKNRTRRLREKVAEGLDAEGKPTAKTIRRVKSVFASEGSAGKNEFLATILKTYEIEVKILGLAEPTVLQHEVSRRNGGPINLSYEQLLALPADELSRLYVAALGQPPPAE